jgi:endonuclease/exonuclease/phosphatase family metal-dependent hydrolase
MGGREFLRVLAVAVGTGLAACVPSHRMTPDLAPGRSCPDVGEHSWFFPEAAGDQARLDDWCRTVGPPVVTSEPRANFGDLQASSGLTVISWNVDVGGGDVLAFLEAELGLTCDGSASRLAPGMTHFGLLVQEAFRRSDEIPVSPDGSTIPRAVAEDERPGDRLDAVSVAARCGLSLVYAAAARNGSEARDGLREDKGVAILATLPLERLRFVELPYEAARRVAVVATVRDASGRGLRLANVHLISVAGPSRVLTTGNGSRLRQGLAAADALDQGEVATLLAGDFNTWSSRETTLRRLREEFPDSPPPLGSATHGAFPTDHILFRAGPDDVGLVEGSYTRLDASYHSDHHPIRVEIRFGR